jgi:hypothetical protein
MFRWLRNFWERFTNWHPGEGSPIDVDIARLGDVEGLAYNPADDIIGHVLP